MQNSVLGNGALDHVVDDDYDKLTVCLLEWWSTHPIIKQLLLECVLRRGRLEDNGNNKVIVELCGLNPDIL